MKLITFRAIADGKLKAFIAKTHGFDALKDDEISTIYTIT
jgi:hypothetical protein